MDEANDRTTLINAVEGAMYRQALRTLRSRHRLGKGECVRISLDVQKALHGVAEAIVDKNLLLPPEHATP